MASGGRSRLKLTGDAELIRQLRRAADTVLDDLAPVIEGAANEALALAEATAPQTAEQGIKVGDTSYREPLKVDKGEGLAVAIVGFEHPRAAYIHESAPGGGPRVRFLRKAANRQRRRLSTALVSALRASLARTFSEKSK